MRVVIMDRSAAALPDSTIEQAWQLVRDMGAEEANTLIIDGITGTCPKRHDVVAGWVALAQGVDELMHATRH